MLSKEFNIGGDWNHLDRVLDKVTSQGCEVPPMYLLLKDHKKVSPDSLIPTRPVVSGCSSMSVHITNILSDILEPLARRLGIEYEFQSTEDLLAKIDNYNDRLQEIREHYEEKLGRRIDADSLGNCLSLLLLIAWQCFPQWMGETRATS